MKRPRAPWQTIGIGLCAIGVVACGSPDAPQDTQFGNQTIVDAGSSGADLGVVNAEFVPTATGTWLHYSHLDVCTDIGVVTFETYTRYLYLVEVEQIDEFGVLNETWQACQIELTELIGLQPFVLESLLTTTWPVETTGLATNTIIGSGYASGLVTEGWGLASDNLGTEAFPLDETDPRVQDTDEDGNPGASLDFGICLAYIAQRTMAQYTGEYVDFDRIEGAAVMTSEQIVIGGNGPLCRTPYETRPHDEGNFFQRVRVDGEGNSLNADMNDDGVITCDEVIGLREALFDRLEADDTRCEVE